MLTTTEVAAPRLFCDELSVTTWSTLTECVHRLWLYMARQVFSHR